MYSFYGTPEFIRFKNGSDISVSIVRAELCCDTAADLPAYDGISGYELAQDSIAWDISTGDFYGLQSDGTWCRQGDISADDNNSDTSLNTSQNRNTEPYPAKTDITAIEPDLTHDVEDNETASVQNLTDVEEDDEGITASDPEVKTDDPIDEEGDDEALRDAESR